MTLMSGAAGFVKIQHARLNQDRSPHTAGSGPATLIRISADGGGGDADAHFCRWRGARAATRARS